MDKTYNLGKIIKNYCDKNKISLREFSRKSKVSHATISRWQNGNIKNASLDSIIKTARIVDVDPIAILYPQYLTEKMPKDAAITIINNTLNKTNITNINKEKIINFIENIDNKEMKK